MFLLIPIGVLAQMDTLNLSQAFVLGDSVVETIEELNSISDVLNADPKIQMNSRGPSGLGTLTMRGGNASQVAVRWNGMDVSSPLLGQSDAAMLNPFLFSEVSVDSGSDDTSNGGISGDLNLTSQPDQKKGILFQVGSQLSSFSNTLYNAKVHMGLEKSSTTIKVFRNGGFNNYPIPLPDGTIKYQNHAKINRSGVMASHSISLKKKKIIELNAWVQDSKVLLPPKIDQTNNTSSQNDSFTRLQAKYEGGIGKNTMTLSGGYSTELNHYIDPLYGYDDKNTFHRYQGNFKWSRRFKKSWEAALHSSLVNISGNTPSYTSSKERRVYAVESYLSKSSRKLFAEAIGGLTFVKGENHHSVRVKTSYYVNEKVSVFSQFHQNFRIPTFNDLYWFPSGNPELETEKSKSVEAGLSWKVSTNKVDFSPLIEYYRRVTENWILWTLDSDVGFWTPFNITEVLSEGVEISVPLKWKISNNYRYVLNTSGQLSRSIFTKPVSFPEINKGEQVYYAPTESFYLSSQVHAHNYTLKLELTHRGHSNGVNYEIADYQKFDASIARLFEVRKHSLELELSVKNMFNQYYEIIERTPLPGRYFNIRINLKSRIK